MFYLVLSNFRGLLFNCEFFPTDFRCCKGVKTYDEIKNFFHINPLNSFQYCFGIMYRRENQRQYELRADTVFNRHVLFSIVLESCTVGRINVNTSYELTRSPSAKTGLITSKWQGELSLYVLDFFVQFFCNRPVTAIHVFLLLFGSKVAL